MHRMRLALALLFTFALAACSNGQAPSAQPAATPPSSTAPAPATAPATPPAPPAKPAKLRVGIVNCNAICGFRFMAQEKGFFKEQNLEVEFVENQNNVNLTKALLAGELEILETQYSTLLRAVGVGETQISVLGGQNGGISFVMFANANIKEPKDLLGKRVGISTPGALPHQLVDMLLKQEKLDPNGVTYLPAGNNPQRMQALLAGKIDATATNFDLQTVIKNQPKFHLAWSFQKYFPNYNQNALTVTRKYADGNADVLVRFLAAYIKGGQYAVDHPDETAKIVAKITQQTPEVAREAVDLYIKSGILNPGLAFRAEQVQYMIDQGAANGDHPKFPASQVFAPEFVQKAKALVR